MRWYRKQTLQRLQATAARVLLRVSALALLLLPAAAAETETVQILQTADLHAHIESGADATEGGGWLRAATLIRSARAAAGPGRSLLIDCGDTVQGTLAGALSRGEIATRMLAALEYDVWVPGNHELDFGERRLAEFCEAVRDKVLCGNLRLTPDGRTLVYPSWRLIRRGRARLAVIGATAQFLPQWFWGRDLGTFEVEAAVTMLARVLPEVRQAQPDMIVLAIHQGWVGADSRGVNEVHRIARRFPEIDLILGGHTHTLQPGMRLGRHTWYVQPGKHGSHVALVRAVLDVEAHRVVDITSRLLAAGPDVDPDPTAETAVSAWLERTRAFAKERVGSVRDRISAEGMPGRSCATSELLSRAIAAAVGVDVVVHGRLSRFSLFPGPVTEAELFRLVPYENSIGTVALTPAELREILREQEANRDSYVYNGLFGARARVTRAGQIRDLELPGPIRDGRVRVALNSYALAGGGGRFPRLRAIVRRPAANLHDTGIWTRTAVREYLGRHPDLSVQARAWLRTTR